MIDSLSTFLIPPQNAILDGSLNISIGLPLGDILTAVIVPLAPSKGQFDLDNGS